jgi:hypothetical protein
MRNRKRILVLAGVAALAFVVLGLASGLGRSRPELYPVRGTVLTADGKPAVGAVVMFHSLGGAGAQDQVIVGVVGEDGTYRLETETPGDGTAPGEYVITLVWPAPRKDSGEKALPIDMATLKRKGTKKGRPPAASQPAGRDQLYGRLADPARSAIRYTVGPGENVVPTIRLP